MNPQHHMDPFLGLYTTTPSTGGVLSVLTHLRASTITVSNYNNYIHGITLWAFNIYQVYMESNKEIGNSWGLVATSGKGGLSQS